MGGLCAYSGLPGDAVLSVACSDMQLCDADDDAQSQQPGQDHGRADLPDASADDSTCPNRGQVLVAALQKQLSMTGLCHGGAAASVLGKTCIVRIADIAQFCSRNPAAGQEKDVRPALMPCKELQLALAAPLVMRAGCMQCRWQPFWQPAQL